MPAPICERVLPDRSVREVSAYRDAVGHELVTHLYYLPGKGFIVAPVNGSGLQVELREVTLLDKGCLDDDLGRCIFDNLLWHEVAVPQERGRTSSDWPAFVASGLKTVRRFQADAVYIFICTENSALNIHARPLSLVNESDGYVGVSANLHGTHDDIGASVRTVIRGVSLLQEGGFY